MSVYTYLQGQAGEIVYLKIDADGNHIQVPANYVPKGYRDQVAYNIKAGISRKINIAPNPEEELGVAPYNDVRCTHTKTIVSWEDEAPTIFINFISQHGGNGQFKCYNRSSILRRFSTDIYTDQRDQQYLFLYSSPDDIILVTNEFKTDIVNGTPAVYDAILYNVTPFTAIQKKPGFPSGNGVRMSHFYALQNRTPTVNRNIEPLTPFIDEYKQPFSISLCLTENNRLTDAFSMFAFNEDIISSTASGVISATTGIDKLDSTLVKILKSCSTISCKKELILIGYPDEIMKKHANEDPIVDALIKIPMDKYVNTRYIDRYWDDKRWSGKFFDDIDGRSVLKSIIKRSHSQNEACRSSTAEFIFVPIRSHVPLLPGTGPAVYANDKNKLDGVIIHAYQVLINNKQQNDGMFYGYSIDSSSSQNLMHTTLLDKTYEIILSHELQKPIKMISLTEEGCPNFSIQGETDLCAIWSFYLMLLYILNPTKTRKDIYLSLDRLGATNRNRLIIMFLYYFSIIFKPLKFVNHPKRVSYIDLQKLWNLNR
jgi:hypothetical protein